MFGFLFRGATYYILWKKFQKQIILAALSIVIIVAIMGIYNDLFEVLKRSHKDNLIALLLFKWFLIVIIVGFNIYKLKQVKFDEDEKREIFKEADESKNKYPKKSQDVLNKKERLTTTTELILKKYTHD
ncbi:MAG: hypothetical protein PHX44_08485 [Sulfurimonas sp.]|uniref:hypothetical protein n=1 Tax=Sulfurimonas sp. TaxID=2022749 RepID=UPI002632AC37|nr:hypothetical protein [Sulfurimonas sp.]MDD2653070.1 hypothetical protein [Sulfurimonas sp.]MDD3452507.1 hypothetical protein [Sulfurimonas sp.]